VEEYMKGFDEQEEIERIQRNKRSREPDEDGFVVVKQRYGWCLCIFLVAAYTILSPLNVMHLLPF
jgi:hypothetical protein